MTNQRPRRGLFCPEDLVGAERNSRKDERPDKYAGSEPLPSFHCVRAFRSGLFRLNYQVSGEYCNERLGYIFAAAAIIGSPDRRAASIEWWGGYGQAAGQYERSCLRRPCCCRKSNHHGRPRFAALSLNPTRCLYPWWWQTARRYPRLRECLSRYR